MQTDWQRHTGVAAERTTLVGFSQGAIMALESTQCGAPRVASRVVEGVQRRADAGVELDRVKRGIRGG